MDKVTYQGLNGAIFALIALDSAGYKVPAAAEDANQTSSEALVAYILDKQLSDGGWALSGDSADPDMTAMAVQALAAYPRRRYRRRWTRPCRPCPDMQLSDGGYSSWGHGEQRVLRPGHHRADHAGHRSRQGQPVHQVRPEPAGCAVRLL